MSFNSSSRPDTTASDAQGRIARKQFNIWKTKFAPIIDETFDWLDDPGFIKSNIDSAKTAVNQAHDASKGSTARAMERYGISMSDEEQAALDKEANLTRSMDLTKTANDVRVASDARRDAVSRGLFGLGQGVAGSVQSGWGQVAGMQSARNSANAANKARAASSNAQAVGSALGLAAAIAL